MVLFGGEVGERRGKWREGESVFGERLGKKREERNTRQSGPFLIWSFVWFASAYGIRAEHSRNSDAITLQYRGKGVYFIYILSRDRG